MKTTKLTLANLSDIWTGSDAESMELNIWILSEMK